MVNCCLEYNWIEGQTDKDSDRYAHDKHIYRQIYRHMYTDERRTDQITDKSLLESLD